MTQILAKKQSSQSIGINSRERFQVAKTHNELLNYTWPNLKKEA
jgi:hypothetical protein